MACCSCCCENGTPPGECCGNPAICCKDPDVCCGPTGSKTCCEDPRVCCGVGSGQECCPEGDLCCGEQCCPPTQECCGSGENQVCCNEGQYCCDGVCSDDPCDGCTGGEDCPSLWFRDYYVKTDGFGEPVNPDCDDEALYPADGPFATLDECGAGGNPHEGVCEATCVEATRYCCASTGQCIFVWESCPP